MILLFFSLENKLFSILCLEFVNIFVILTIANKFSELGLDDFQAFMEDEASKNKIDRLLDVPGDILEENGYDNLGLTNDIIAGTRKIKNAHRLCMLLDLVLRYMDAVAVSNRRWFYRQIASALTHNIAGKGKKK